MVFYVQNILFWGTSAPYMKRYKLLERGELWIYMNFNMIGNFSAI